MKITIKSCSADRKNLLPKLIDVINKKVNGVFVEQNGMRIGVRSNANADLHTRLIAIIILWLCLKNKQYGCHAYIGYSEKHGVYFKNLSDDCLVELIPFIEGLDLENIELSK